LREKFKHIFLVLTPSERQKFWTLILLHFFISIADIAALAFLLFVINFYIHPSVVSGQEFLPDWFLKPGSVTLIAVFFFVFGIKNITGILVSDAQHKFIGRVAVRISQANMQSYQQGSYEQFVNMDSSVYIRKIALQPFEFCQYILSGIQQITIQSALIILTVTAILFYNAKLFLLLFLILLPPVVSVFFIIKRKLTTAKKNIQTSNERSFRYLLDALKGYVESNIYNRNDFFFQRFSNARQQFSKHLFNSISVQSMPSRIIETFAVLGLFILIVVAKWSGGNDSSTLITIGAFMAATYKIIPGIVKIINAAGQMRAYEGSIHDLIAVPEKSEIPGQPDKTNSLFSLQMLDVSFNYGEHQVLKDFSLTIKKGEITGIAGKSGKGKTTILNLLLGFLRPGEGKILFNDQPVSQGEIKSYWSQFSYVRQQPFFIHDTILRNIILEEHNYDKTKLEKAITVTGLKDLISQSADGLDKIITENGKNISGGQQQRISIARALYKDAGIILLDEPFNELDETSTSVLMRYFLDMAVAGKTVVLVTHDSQCLSFCHKIISLDEQ
jgi:ABC-type multidrug transport system fused ATPase/permease subunit